MRINSIFTKFLTLNLGVAVLLALSLLAAMTYAVNSALTLQTRHNLASYQRSIDAELDDLRREFQGQAAALARNPAFAQALARKDAGAVRAFLLQAREQPLCDLATATDAAGIVIARGHALNVGDSMRGNSLYAAALPGSNAAAGVASSGIEAGAVYPLNLQAVHPVVLDGKQVGVVSLGYNLAGNSFVDTIHTRLGVTCSIYKGTTRVATTLTDNGQRAVGVTLENPEVLHTVLRQGQSLETRNTVYDTEYDTLFWPLRDAQGSIVGMFVMGTPRHAAQAMEQGILLAVLGIGAAALVVVTGLSALFARKMTRPLATATQFAAQVAAGDLRQTLTVTGGDEIGQLADALRTMVAELKRRLAFAQGVLEGVSNGSPCAFTNPDGNIAYVNDKIVALAGREGPPESFHGMPMNVFMNRDISKGTPSVEALHSGQRVERQVQLPNALGGARVVNVTANPVRDLDGNLSGVFTLYYDLTQLVAQQEALAQANANIQRVAGEACRMAEVVSSASSQIAAQVEQTTKGADMQAARVQETSASMQQMTATVMDVARSAAQASSNTDAATQTARRGEAVVQEVVEAIGKMHGQMARLNESMDALGSRAQGIGQVLTTIKDIADQTNLLALNAAIEAARAGDAGRGFAVVADEVRKLAEKTVAATQEVETAVTQIQLGVHSTVQATSAARTQVEEAITLAERSGASLHEIVSIVENASAQVQAIAAASEEQSAATEEIARVIEEVRHIAEEMYAGMNESSTAVSSLAYQAVALQQLTTELHQ